MALNDAERAALEGLAHKVITNAEVRQNFIANPSQVIEEHAPEINDDAKANIASNAEKISGLTENMDNVSSAAAFFFQYA